MKLLFSEFKSDYSHYIFPYAVWAVPEAGERPSLMFASGFLPSSYKLDRYYMCRHVRVATAAFSLSSENRRILRKGGDLSMRLLPKKEFKFTADRLAFCKNYADAKFGPEVMSTEKLEKLFASPVCSHILVFTDMSVEREVGYVFLYLDQQDAAFYYYSFYDLNHGNKSLGMFMMTSAVVLMQEKKIDNIYLGSCYSRNALYKTQFQGCQFWNGFRWSSNLKELKFLIDRDGGEVTKHLLETPEFADQFYPEGYEL